MKIEELNILEKVGQKFIFGVNSRNIDVIIKLIKNYHIGGVILYKKNYSNYNEMLLVIKKLKEANSKNKIPLFIAIDQEGGRVNRMPSEFKNLKNMYDISRINKDLVKDSADITGKMLYDTGINMNFAPVMDIYDVNNKILYNRCFYSDISDNGINYANGLRKNGIISVIKHLPGHGSTKMDSHFITPYVFNYKKILDKHIIPFEDAIKNGVDAIMLGHLVIRGMTGGLPVSISSKFIQEYLRDKNNFHGLVITDELNMLSRNILYRPVYIKRALLSGSDIILVKIKNENDAINMISKGVKLASRDDVYMKLLNNSVDRIIKIKEKYKISDKIFNGCNIDKINENIEKINKMCI